MVLLIEQLLIRLFLWAIVGVTAWHHCTYENPKSDEVIASVVQTTIPLRHRRSRSTFRRIRILPYFDSSLGHLDQHERMFVEKNVKLACEFWEATLSVRPLASSMVLERRCAAKSLVEDCCQTPCRNVTYCGTVAIPTHHLKSCNICNQRRPVLAPTSGLNNVDFVLYVSVVDADRCRYKENVAYAAHCQMESTLNRPIAGYMNICPHSVSAEEKDHEVLFSTMKHEILHALGFSAALFAYFRDDRGQPLTKRDEYGIPRTFNPNYGFFEPGDQVVRTVVRTDWHTRFGRRAHEVRMLITPRVQREVQRHFNCSHLEGAELENQGTNGTVFGHWEKRLFENEAMTGTHTQNPVYSRITLALMEDTGWYRADYSVGEQLDWGRNLGCQFAMKSCGEWIRDARMRKKLPWPYCTEVKMKTGWKDMKTTCNSMRNSLVLCHLVEYDQELPEEYQYFDQLDNVPRNMLGHYGGSVALADYCPYLQEFEWRNGPSQRHRDSRCSIATNTPDRELNGALELYGPNSGCFNFAAVWTQRNCHISRAYPYHGAGCYEYECSNGTLWLKLWNDTRRHPCLREGQVIKIRRLVDDWYHEGSILCPSCETMCQKRSNFECQSWVADLPADIYDVPIGLPCGGSYMLSSQKIVLLLTFLSLVNALF